MSDRGPTLHIAAIAAEGQRTRDALRATLLASVGVDDDEASKIFAELLREHAEAFRQLDGGPAAPDVAAAIMVREAYRLFAARNADIPRGRRADIFCTAMRTLLLQADVGR